MKILLYICSICLMFFMLACSSSEETTKNDEVYVFDEIPADSTVTTEIPSATMPELNVTYYVVQIGAFTTRERAEEYEAQARKDLKKELQINYSNNVNLFVVQLVPIFKDKTEAENVKKEIWKQKKYADAWIVTVNK